MAKENKLKEPIKVRVEWTDETFDFVEFVDKILDFKTKCNAGILGKKGEVLKEKTPVFKIIEINEYKK